MIGLVSLPLMSLAACLAPVGLGPQAGDAGEPDPDPVSATDAAPPSASDAATSSTSSSSSGGTTVSSATGTGGTSTAADAGAPSDASVDPSPAPDASVPDAGSPFGASALDPSAPLQIAHDVNVDGLTSDRFTWRDSQNESRSAVLAHNDGPSGAGGSNGGELRELDYVTSSGATRVAHAPPTSFGGFGYVVAHRSEGTDGLGDNDDSPLGHFFPGTWTRLFEGRNHAIFRFTQTYPRYATTTAANPNARYDVPVTIDWVFSTGHDAPLWAVTWDLSGVPANAVESDSRAPYGEMLFDGSADLDSHSVIAGVGWGDRYKFTTTGGPVTFNSDWTWDTPNTIPYVEIWTAAVDAAMGIVQTQTLSQHDAGGYWGIDRWNSTSAGGNACNTSTGDLDSVMPCDFNWPYQTIQYAFNDPNTPTNDPRIAWGAEFGFLGQTSYQANGSSWYGGPVPSVTAAGWPKQSYSTYIALGEKSAEPVEASVGAVETDADGEHGGDHRHRGDQRPGRHQSHRSAGLRARRIRPGLRRAHLRRREQRARRDDRGRQRLLDQAAPHRPQLDRGRAGADEPSTARRSSRTPTPSSPFAATRTSSGSPSTRASRAPATASSCRAARSPTELRSAHSWNGAEYGWQLETSVTGLSAWASRQQSWSDEQ